MAQNQNMGQTGFQVVTFMDIYECIKVFQDEG